MNNIKFTFIAGPPHFNWDFYKLNDQEKPLFTNDLYATQTKTFPGYPEQKYVLCYFRENDRYLVQVLFNDLAVYSNNSYAIYFWDKTDYKKSFCCEYPSHVIFPKVWDCAFVMGLMDCANYFATQMVINKVMEYKNAPQFELDLDKTKRDVVMCGQPLEEVERLIKENKSFKVISLRAELQNFEVKLDCPWDKKKENETNY